MITFNVIFTPGTPARLLPLALSLLQGEEVGVRLVANGCSSDDTRLLRAAATLDRRVTWHALEVDRPIEHGQALNHLFEVFPEREFAIADSDVVCSGNFVPDLWPPGAACSAAFTGSSVWTTAEDTVVRAGCTFLGARQRQLRDGTPVGNTYVAIYERDALAPAFRAAPRGFGTHEWWMLPRWTQRAFVDRSWRFRTFDTGRVINLLLLLEGHRLDNHNVSTLHHVGGFSSADFPRPREDVTATLGTVWRILTGREGHRLQRLLDGAVHRAYLIRSRREASHREMNRRRNVVREHVTRVIDCLRAGDPVPPQPGTGCPEVDVKVTALQAALEDQYTKGQAALDTALRSAH